MDQEDFKNTIQKIANSFDQETIDKTKEGLEDYWFFEWKDHLSIETNIYCFHRELNLYQNRCRKWEEHHNGMCCVVERVRDEYLMPKIKEFKEKLLERIETNEQD